TEEYDPHPSLFDEALAALESLGTSLPGQQQPVTGLRLARFELVLLRELGYSPVLEACAVCQTPVNSGHALSFSPAASGVLCGRCQERYRDRKPLSLEAWQALRALPESGEAWQRPWS